MLGARLKRLREIKPGCTQERLAAAAGVRQSHISRIESGDIKNVRGDLLAKIAQGWTRHGESNKESRGES